jgi:hypothetical protein
MESHTRSALPQSLLVLLVWIPCRLLCSRVDWLQLRQTSLRILLISSCHLPGLHLPQTVEQQSAGTESKLQPMVRTGL